MRLPYPGLRAFTRNEADLFFGRERSVDEMVDCLAKSHFLSVLGTSGSGKSSLVRTGLLEALELGLLAQGGSRWLFADMHPGGQPLRNLATRLIKTVPARSADPDEIEIFRFFLKRGPRSIIEWCRVGNLPKNTNLLILVDQFEELFRYGDYSQREEAEAFVALLLESAANTEFPVYVVMTMRSEYLGACALIPDLAEQINKSLYLTPRMTRTEVREAIVGPAQTIGFEIEDALVTRLLNDLAAFAPWEAEQSPDQILRLSRRADQLPLMQHVLNRLWLRAQAKAEKGAATTLRLAEYETIGGLTGALDAHALEVLKQVSQKERDVEAVFRCLIEGYGIANAVRRPCSIAKLVSETGKPAETVRTIIDGFRATECNFLQPPPNQTLDEETIVDISHEALIRQWSLLASWLENENRAGANWQRLRLAASLYREKAGDLLHGLDLANLDAWWRTEEPSLFWSERYGGGFAGVQAFLQESRIVEARAAEKQRRARRRKMWALGGVATVCAVFGIGAVIYAASEEILSQRFQVTMERADSLFSEGVSAEKNNDFEKALTLYEKTYNELLNTGYDNEMFGKYVDIDKVNQGTIKTISAIRRVYNQDNSIAKETSYVDRFVLLNRKEFSFAMYLFNNGNDIDQAFRAIIANDSISRSYLKQAETSRVFDESYFIELLSNMERLCPIGYFANSPKIPTKSLIRIRRQCFYYTLSISKYTERLKPLISAEASERILERVREYITGYIDNNYPLRSWEVEGMLGKLLVQLAEVRLLSNKAGSFESSLNLLREASNRFFSSEAASRLAEIYSGGVGGIPANNATAAEYRRASLDRKTNNGAFKIPLIDENNEQQTEYSLDLYDPRYIGEDALITAIMQLENFEGYTLPEERRRYLAEIFDLAKSHNDSPTRILSELMKQYEQYSTYDEVITFIRKAIQDNKPKDSIDALRFAYFKYPNEVAERIAKDIATDVPRDVGRYRVLLDHITSGGSLAAFSNTLSTAIIENSSKLTTQDQARLFYQRARIKAQLSDDSGAANDIGLALSLAPNDAKILSRYSMKLIEEEKKIALGTRIAERAYRADPNDYSAQEAWGWSQVRAGEEARDKNAVERGVVFLESAVQLAIRQDNRSDEAALRYHLGHAYTLLGRGDEATTQLNQALEARPAYETSILILREKRLMLRPSEDDTKALEDIAIRLIFGQEARESSISVDASRIAIRGYDPVAFFTAGRATLGLPRFYWIWKGAVWFFMSENNRDEFKARPDLYAPVFGGFCAYCAASNHKYHSVPEYYRIYEGRLYLHLTYNYLSQWINVPTAATELADSKWKTLAAANTEDAIETELTKILRDAIDKAGRIVKQSKQAFEKAEFENAVNLLGNSVATLRHAEINALGKVASGTAGALGSLSWYQIFAKKFSAAITSADEALTLAPQEISFVANKAHALMLLGRTDDARALYLKYKEQDVASMKKSWNLVILDDFQQLRKQNLTRPLMDEVERALKPTSTAQN